MSTSNLGPGSLVCCLSGADQRRVRVTTCLRDKGGDPERGDGVECSRKRRISARAIDLGWGNDRVCANAFSASTSEAITTTKSVGTADA